MTAPAEMPGEDDVARALAEALRQKPIPDDVWRGMVESFHHLEGKFPDYANGYSVSTDAFRLARAAQALFAPILAENASLRETLRSNSVWDFPRDIQNLTVKLDAAEARALAAEAALAAERERCAKVAEGVSTFEWRGGDEWASGYVDGKNAAAAAIRAEGE